MMPANPQRPAKLPGLQVLRGVAALAVMWCHLKYNLGLPPNYPGEPSWLTTDLGAIGVDIFFVISGFVIAMTASKAGRDWRSFLANRVARVVPLYYVISACFLAFNPFSDRASFAHLFNTFGFIPIFDTHTFSDTLCVNGWTLSFEMWFYFGFACLIKLVGGREAGIKLTWFLATGVILTTCFYHSPFWYLPKFLFNPLALEFCAGCALYRFHHRLGTRTAIVLGVLAAVFLVLADWTQALGRHWAILASPTLALRRTAVWGVFAFCLVAVVIYLDIKWQVTWPRPLLVIGDSSYSIYLIAPLVMPLYSHTIGGYFYPPPIVYGTIYVLGTVFGGILVWKYLEVPVTRLGKKFLVPKSQSGESSIAPAE